MKRNNVVIELVLRGEPVRRVLADRAFVESVMELAESEDWLGFMNTLSDAGFSESELANAVYLGAKYRTGRMPLRLLRMSSAFHDGRLTKFWQAGRKHIDPHAPAEMPPVYPHDGSAADAVGMSPEAYKELPGFFRRLGISPDKLPPNPATSGKAHGADSPSSVSGIEPWPDEDDAGGSGSSSKSHPATKTVAAIRQ